MHPRIYLSKGHKMEVTKREIIFSIVIICVMLVIGIIFSGMINDYLMEMYQEYNTALQIDNDVELFQYGMRTNIGNAFVYGELAAVDPVSTPKIEGLYGSITKETQKYTKHTRVVTERVNGKTKSKTKTYWTWDTIKTEHSHATTISFLGVSFPYGTIDYCSEEYISTVDTGVHLREKYYGSRTSYVGTLYANLGDNTITHTSFYNDESIEDTIKSLESSWQLVLFWIGWIILIVACVYGFYYLDNRWLEQ